MVMKPLRIGFIAAVATIGLAGCGGGGDNNSASTTTPTSSSSDEVPASASASVPGLIGWASTLPASETDQPLLTDKFNPPVDDTAQPMPV